MLRTLLILGALARNIAVLIPIIYQSNPQMLDGLPEIGPVRGARASGTECATRTEVIGAVYQPKPPIPANRYGRKVSGSRQTSAGISPSAIHQAQRPSRSTGLIDTPGATLVANQQFERRAQESGIFAQPVGISTTRSTPPMGADRSGPAVVTIDRFEDRQ